MAPPGVARQNKPKLGSKTRRKAQEARNATLRRLSRPLKREMPHQMSIASNDLQPLIELAYWSTFTEVRRDAAAAFVALCSKDDNLHTLSRAGALGALLALMGGTDHSQHGVLDPECRRDAALAVANLCKLDDIKSRLLSSPHGLETVLEMIQDPDDRVKRAALHIVERLCDLRETCVAVIKEYGLKDLAPQLNCGDHTVRTRAARVLHSVAHHDLEPHLLYDPSVVQSVLQCLEDDFAPSDEPVQASLLTYVRKTADNMENKALLAKDGLARMLLRKLTLQSVELGNISVILQVLLSLCGDEANHHGFLHEDSMLPQLCALVFRDLPLRRRTALPTKSAFGCKQSAEKLSMSLVRAKEDTETLKSELGVVQTLAKIILTLAEVPANAEAIIQSKSLTHFNASMLSEGEFAGDKKLIRRVALTLWNLTNHVRASQRMCHMLGAQGSIDLAQFFLMGHDDERKGIAVRTFAIFMRHTNLHSLLTSPHIFRELVAMGYLPNEQLAVAELVHRISEFPSFFPLILENGAIKVILYILKSHEVIRIPENLAKWILETVERMVKVSGVDKEIIESDTLGHIYKISKMRDNPSARSAKQITRGMRQEVSLLKIQLVVANFVRAVRARKERKKEIERREMEKQRALETERAIKELERQVQAISGFELPYEAQE